jgi:inner membrane protein
MDNLTHTLAGLLVAELAIARQSDTRLTRKAYFVSALANNLPDFDFLYTRITSGKLGYLIHHRGHTHTLPIALLLGLALHLAMRTRSKTLLALALFGPVLHIAMDFGNVYGVHPFWPLYDGWIYGDAVFIVEPFLWATTLPALLYAVKNSVGRTLVGLLLAVTVVLPFLTGLIATPFAAAVAVATCALTLACVRLSRPRRALVGGLATLCVYLAFTSASLVGKSRARAALSEAYPSEKLVDLVATTLPANPLCLQLHTITLTVDEVIVTRIGRLSLLPSLFPAERCALREEGYTARRRIAEASPEGFLVGAEVRLARGELLRHAERCDVYAYLRFARVPFFVEQPDGKLVVGDLRFDRGPGLEFAELELPPLPADCPRRVAPWIPPRDDLLHPR